MSNPEVAPVPGDSAEENKVTPPKPPEPAPSSRFEIRLLDLLERLLVLSFYAYFFWNNIPMFLKETPGSLSFWMGGLLLLSEGLVVLVLLFRRPAHSFSISVADWLLALGTTILPSLFLLTNQPLEPAWVGASLLIAGLCGRSICTLFLGRSFGLVPANRGVKRHGPYRLVRHPMYLSYLIVHLGVLWLNPLLWNVVVFLVCWFFMLIRILVEENHLSQDPEYAEYQKKVRYMMIPGVF
jgi:protein-S-isoprenylcysteine O-methyltransferase Ste14